MTLQQQNLHAKHTGVMDLAGRSVPVRVSSREALSAECTFHLRQFLAAYMDGWEFAFYSVWLEGRGPK